MPDLTILDPLEKLTALVPAEKNLSTEGGRAIKETIGQAITEEFCRIGRDAKRRQAIEDLFPPKPE